MSITRKSLVLRTEKTKKLKLFNHKTETTLMVHLKDGELFTLITWEMKLTERRDK